MPGMTGIQLFEKIKEKSTDLKAVLLTGYQGKEFPGNKDLKVVTKPVMPSELAKIVKNFVNPCILEHSSNIE
jgi:YesN/AraC family two-component response regulator